MSNKTGASQSFVQDVTVEAPGTAYSAPLKRNSLAECDSSAQFRKTLVPLSAGRVSDPTSIAVAAPMYDQLNGHS